jgi:hypothetical protein
VPDLARACRSLLERELSVLKPRLVATLGAGATDAFMAGPVSACHSVSVPHPSGWAWRKITASTHDDWLRPACEALGLDWDRERGALHRFLESIAKDPWG